MSISVRSDVFEPGGKIPRPHTGDGADISPPLSWSGLPEGTAQVTLIVDDPDAPTPQPWVHWLLYAIPGGLDVIHEGFHGTLVPPGFGGLRQGKNSWATIGYRGPAPPRGHGVHHYHFRVYALDRALALPAGLDRPTLWEAIRAHVIGEGELVGTYERT